jgi:hypothetical protein
MWIEESRSTTGIVLVFSNIRSALWDSSVGEMVDQVEDRLDGVYVTSAVTAGGRPSVADGVAAVRFAGCTSALVVYVGDRSERLADTLWRVPVRSVTVRPDPDAVAEAFHAHAVQADRAA